jgi:hypothetical protein
MTETTRDYFRDRGVAFNATTFPAENNAPLVVYLLSDLAATVRGQVVRAQGRLLNLMTHPAVLSPGIESECWTVQEVAQAFTSLLARRQLPAGVQSYEVTLRDYAVPYDTTTVNAAAQVNRPG